MHKLLLSTSVGVLALLSIGAAQVAADELEALQKDPKQWALPTGDYANHRYSLLKQITAENVHRLAPAWSFSTGVLRGHEGAPARHRRRDVFLIRRSRTSSMRSTSTTTARSSGNTSPSRIRASFR